MGQALKQASPGDWMDAALAAVTDEDCRDLAALAALAVAPVKPAPEYPPLETAGAPVIRVGTETIEVEPPAESWEVHGDRADFTEDWGSQENNQAAMRNYLDQPFEWGRGADGREELRLAAMLEVDGKLVTVVLVGTESAIRRALPDKTTLDAWEAAGAVEFPLWNFDADAGPIGSVCWVPLADVARRLRVVQMEYASRLQILARD